MSATAVPKLYRTVIDDVINNVRDIFLDDGVDEQVLLELKQVWEKKLMETKAIDHKEPEMTVTPPGNNGQSNQNRINTNRLVNQGVKNHQTTILQHVNFPQKQPQFIQGQVVQQPGHLAHSQLSQPSPASVSRNIATTSSAIGQQLNFAAGSVIPQTLFQYTTGEAVDGSKTVASVPQKVIFAFNPQTQGLQTVMSSPAAAATLALPSELTATLLQQAALNAGNVINVTQSQPTVVQQTNNQTNAINNGSTIQYQASSSNQLNQRNVQSNSRPTQQNRIVQLDGPNDSSEEEDDDDDFRDNDDDHDDNDDDQNDDDNEYTGEEEEPLNSEDDVSDEDVTELFDTDNVVVCQYDKISRSRNKWKFHLKDGIMNLQGKDYVFQKAIGDAEW